MYLGARLRRAWSWQGNRPLIALISLLRGSQEHMRGVVGQPFALSLGIPMRSLGALESTLDLTRISAQPLFGSASDASGRKRFLILRELLLIAALVFFIFAGSWHFLLVGVVLTGLSLAIEPVWSSFVAESSGPGELGRAYSVVYASFMGAGLFAPVTAGLLADSFGYASVFLLCAVFGLLTLLILKAKILDDNRHMKRAGITQTRLLSVLAGTLRPPRRLWGFYLSMALDGISFGIGSRLLFGMLTRSHGYSPFMLSLITSATTVTWALAQIPIGRVVDRIGYRRSLAVAQALSCGYLVGIIVSQRFEVILAMSALIGFTAALWVPAEQAWIAGNVEPEKRGEHLGSYYAFRGLLAFPSPFVGGFLYDSFGFSVPLIVNLVGAAIDTVLIATLIRDKLSPEAHAES